MSAVTAEVKNELLGILANERKEYEKVIEEKTKGIIDPIRADVLKKLEERYDELQALIEKPSPTLTKDGEEARQRDIKSAMVEMYRKNRIVTNAFLDIPEVKAMTTNVDSDGGYFVTPDTGGRIVAKVYETSLVRQYASVQSISSDKLEGMIDNDEAASGWVGEQGTRSDTATPQFGMWNIEAFEQYAHAKISQKLLDDAGIDVGSLLEAKIGQILGRTENAAFVSGAGVIKPRGFTAYPTAATADDTRAWGTLEHVLSGASADFAASNPVDKIFDLTGSLKPQYEGNARFYTNRAVRTKMRKLKVSADLPYIWEPSVVAGTPSRLNGFEVVIFPDMPALAANSLSLAYGDLKATYQIVDRLGIRMLRDNLTAKPFIIFYATKRTGGGIVNFESLKFMKFNA